MINRLLLFLFCLLNTLVLQAKDVNLVFIGNSITAGAGLTNSEVEAPPARVQTLLQKEQGINSVDIANLGVSGATTIDFLPETDTLFPRIIKAADQFSTQEGVLIFSIMIGTNDSAESGPLGAPVSNDLYKKNIKTITDSLLQRYPTASIILHHPLWYSLNTHNAAVYLKKGAQRLVSYLSEIDSLVDSYSKEGISRVYVGDREGYNLFRLNYTHLFTPEKGAAGTFYLHPNNEGAIRLAELWNKAIYNVVRYNSPLTISLDTTARLLLYPAQASITSKAVLICPGGGYGIKSMEHEGIQIAHWLSNQGITAAVLDYRLPQGDGRLPLVDAQQAISLLRNQKDEWGSYEQVGIMGFSAGGHLAATVSTLSKAESRPDFQVLFYPVISMQTDLTHLYSRSGFMGDNPDKKTIDKYSNELQVSQNTPPAFIALSADDEAVLPENSFLYAKALASHKIPYALHVYPSGGHGWGWYDTFYYKPQWKAELLHWLSSF